MAILKGTDFILRPAKLRDAKSIYELQKDKYIVKNFISVPKNIEEVKKEIKRHSKKQKLFGKSF